MALYIYKEAFMKKLLIAGIIGFTALGAQADPHRGYYNHNHHHGGGWGWVAPAIIGGTIVYAATRPPVVAQPPVIVQQPALTPAPIGYRYEQILDANCNCYRVVLVPIN